MDGATVCFPRFLPCLFSLAVVQCVANRLCQEVQGYTHIHIYGGGGRMILHGDLVLGFLGLYVFVLPSVM